MLWLNWSFFHGKNVAFSAADFELSVILKYRTQFWWDGLLFLFFNRCQFLGRWRPYRLKRKRQQSRLHHFRLFWSRSKCICHNSCSYSFFSADNKIFEWCIHPFFGHPSVGGRTFDFEQCSVFFSFPKLFWSLAFQKNTHTHSQKQRNGKEIRKNDVFLNSFSTRDNTQKNFAAVNLPGLQKKKT